jgi:anhydro-N-acetylmuramic acid kinase
MAQAANPPLALGLMSGTSLDGVDAALIRTDGRRIAGFGAARTVAYAPDFRERLRAILGGVGAVADVERELTDIHADAVRRLLAEAGVAAADVRVVGFHGHTILHRPRAGRTWQIGDGVRLAQAVGIDVVCDFRSADVAAGGEGAPFVPLYHQALAADLEKPLAVLNVGGVANLTYIGPDGAILAFDTGPGNALIDDWMLARTGSPVDRDGRTAAAGRIDEAAVAAWLAGPYFARKPPKSLDRLDFEASRIAHLPLADGAATLAALTAAAVARGVDHLPTRPRRWLVTGGGRHNRFLMAELGRRLGAPVDPVEAAGWDGDALEAQAFAFLAMRNLAGLPLSLPSTTGVRAPTPGGRLFRAKRA